MNRKKKVISTLKKKAKKANAKLAPNSNKPRYISKAEREKMAMEQETNSVMPEAESSKTETLKVE